MTDIDPRNGHERALRRTAQLAGELQARVTLLLCAVPDPSVAEGQGAAFRDAQQEHLRRLEAWLERQAATLKREGIDVRTEIRRHTPRYEAILEAARASGADLVLRAARHHSRIERLLVSATDWELVRHATQTLWLVKQRSDTQRRGLRVLAAIDPVHMAEQHEGLDRRIVEAAAGIAAVDGGELHVFHAWQPGAAIAPALAAGPHVPMPLARIDAATIDELRRQRRALMRAASRGYDVADERLHLCEGPVVDELDALVEHLGVDVVVAGGIARGRLQRLVIGSTAEAVVEQVDCDVVVVRPDPSRQAAA